MPLDRPDPLIASTYMSDISKNTKQTKKNFDVTNSSTDDTAFLTNLNIIF